MDPEIEENSYTGLKIFQYNSENIYPLLPLLAEEFPNWTVDKIKNYVKLVVAKKNEIAGMLVAKNEALYNVGLLIYTFQSVGTKYLNNCEEHSNSKEKFTNGIVVENIIASSPILKPQVFLIIVEHAMRIGKNNKCKFIELPKFDETYRLINEKYKDKIIKINNFRTAIKLG